MIKKIGELSYISTRQDGSKYFKLLGKWESNFNEVIQSDEIHELVFGPGNWNDIELGSSSSEIHAITFEEYFKNSFLYTLDNIRSFTVRYPLSTSLDFTRFPHIVHLDLVFPKKHVVHQYPAGLKSMILEKYREHDLREFAHLTDMNNFVARFGCISGFEGTEQWPLKKLSLFRTMNFTKYYQLTRFQKLELLELQQCPEINDISFMNSFESIKGISLLDMGSVSLSRLISGVRSKIRLAGTTRESCQTQET